jgi:hypothetical protein
MIKWILIVGVIAWLTGYISFADAHGSLAVEKKEVGNYTLGFSITGDSPVILEDIPLSYEFRLFNKDGSEDVPFKSAYVFFTRKTGELVLQTELMGPRDFIPGAILDMAIQDPGEYLAEVVFVLAEESPVPEVRAEFEYVVRTTETEPLPLPKVAESEPEEKGLPGYVWAIIVFAIGVVVGRKGKKLLGLS